MADKTSELLWVISLFTKFGHTPTTNPVIYCDNLFATHLSDNPVFHSRMKHIALAYHFVRENVQHGKFRVSFVSTDDQHADILTKPLFVLGSITYCPSCISLSDHTTCGRISIIMRKCPASDNMKKYAKA